MQRSASIRSYPFRPSKTHHSFPRSVPGSRTTYRSNHFQPSSITSTKDHRLKREWIGSNARIYGTATALTCGGVGYLMSNPEVSTYQLWPMFISSSIAGTYFGAEQSKRLYDLSYRIADDVDFRSFAWPTWQQSMRLGYAVAWRTMVVSLMFSPLLFQVLTELWHSMPAPETTQQAIAQYVFMGLQVVFAPIMMTATCLLFDIHIPEIWAPFLFAQFTLLTWIALHNLRTRAQKLRKKMS
eukprot:TRINITY_DN19612_c0_g2_i1.p1 TRINITY_DN19612_c0_g2~~TRINITY_DN19612_c0_g2_i1.p1  ORF type:complete len:240 (+),score=25.75 TRINITY_DN19612_c0_g2_i1:44-763(+)